MTISSTSTGKIPDPDLGTQTSAEAADEPGHGPGTTGERADLIETLGKHRFFLTYTARDLTDEQASSRSTVSSLCIGGLIKHVTRTERMWIQFAQGRTEALSSGGEQEHAAGFQVLPGETLAGLLEQYAEEARSTDAWVAAVPDLDHSEALPPAPWFEPGARWSVRRVLLHVIAETAQHAGHADIVREALDGAKSMG
jgi:uncharacterized damage-inducible protein DinB